MGMLSSRRSRSVRQRIPWAGSTTRLSSRAAAALVPHSPAVDVKALAQQDALAAVVGQAAEGCVRGDVAVQDRQVQEVQLVLRPQGCSPGVNCGVNCEG